MLRLLRPFPSVLHPLHVLAAADPFALTVSTTARKLYGSVTAISANTCRSDVILSKSISRHEIATPFSQFHKDEVIHTILEPNLVFASSILHGNRNEVHYKVRLMNFRPSIMRVTKLGGVRENRRISNRKGNREGKIYVTFRLRTMSAFFAWLINAEYDIPC